MQRQEQLQVLNQLLHHLETHTTADAGGIRRNPVEVYRCPQLAAREQQVFFNETPLLVGLSFDLPNTTTRIRNVV